MTWEATHASVLDALAFGDLFEQVSKVDLHRAGMLEAVCHGKPCDQQEVSSKSFRNETRECV